MRRDSLRIRQGILVGLAARYFSKSVPVKRRNYDDRCNVLAFVGNDLMRNSTINGCTAPHGPLSEVVERVFFDDCTFHEYRLEAYFAVLKPGAVSQLAKRKLYKTELDVCDKFFRQYLRADDSGDVVIGEDYPHLWTRRLLYLE